MHKEVHANIVRNIASYFEIDKMTFDQLCDYTVIPDEKATEHIRDFEMPEPKNFLNQIGNAFGWIGNAIVELGTWAHLHGSGAPEQFLAHLEVAYNLLVKDKSEDGENYERGIRNLAYCLHYITDTGTPFHSKPWEDAMHPYLDEYAKRKTEMTEEELKELNYEILWIILMFIYYHSEFETKVQNDWDKAHLRKEHTLVVRRAVSKLDKFPRFQTIEDILGVMRNEIHKLREFAVEQFDELDKGYRWIAHWESQKLNNKIETSEKEVSKIGILCTYQISRLVALVLTIFFKRRS